jgi:hypothetical protein
MTTHLLLAVSPDRRVDPGLPISRSNWCSLVGAFESGSGEGPFSRDNSRRNPKNQESAFIKPAASCPR